MVYSIAFLALMLWGLVAFLGRRWGWPGAVVASLFGLFCIRGMFTGMAGGEVRKMITTRPRRAAAWLVVLGGLGAALGLVWL